MASQLDKWYQAMGYVNQNLGPAAIAGGAEEIYDLLRNSPIYQNAFNNAQRAGQEVYRRTARGLTKSGVNTAGTSAAAKNMGLTHRDKLMSQLLSQLMGQSLGVSGTNVNSRNQFGSYALGGLRDDPRIWDYLGAGIGGLAPFIPGMIDGNGQKGGQ